MPAFFVYDGCLPGRRPVFNPKVPQRGKRIEKGEEALNPKQPQKVKRIETAGKIFNPKKSQRDKRIEKEEEALNPKWLQKTKWIETLVSVRKNYAPPGAVACLSLN